MYGAAMICIPTVVRLEMFGSAARGVDFDPAKGDAVFHVEFDLRKIRRCGGNVFARRAHIG